MKKYVLFNSLTNTLSFEEETRKYDFSNEAYLGFYECPEEDMYKEVYSFLKEVKENEDSMPLHFANTNILEQAMCTILKIKPELIL